MNYEVTTDGSPWTQGWATISVIDESLWVTRGYISYPVNNREREAEAFDQFNECLLDRNVIVEEGYVCPPQFSGELAEIAETVQFSGDQEQLETHARTLRAVRSYVVRLLQVAQARETMIGPHWDPDQEITIQLAEARNAIVSVSRSSDGMARLNVSPIIDLLINDSAFVIEARSSRNQERWRTMGYSDAEIQNYAHNAQRHFMQSEISRTLSEDGLYFFDPFILAQNMGFPRPSGGFNRNYFKPAIIAHELCHHLLEHTRRTKFEPRLNENFGRRDAEVEADVCAIALTRDLLREQFAFDASNRSDAFATDIAFFLAAFAQFREFLYWEASTHYHPAERMRRVLLADRIRALEYSADFDASEMNEIFKNAFGLFTWDPEESEGEVPQLETFITLPGDEGSEPLSPTAVSTLLELHHFEMSFYMDFLTTPQPTSLREQRRLTILMARHSVWEASRHGLSEDVLGSILRYLQSVLPELEAPELRPDLVEATLLMAEANHLLGNQVESRDAAQVVCELINCSAQSDVHVLGPAPRRWTRERLRILGLYDGDLERLRADLGEHAPFGDPTSYVPETIH